MLSNYSITHLSIALQKYRLKDAFRLEPVGTRVASPPVKHKASEVRPAASESETDSPRAGRLPAFQSRIIGEPEDLDGARQLASEDRYQFQWWALSLIKARPLGGSAGSKEGKKGSDKGIDGTMVFTDIDERTGVSALRAKRVIVQVKSGHVKSGDIRDLVGAIDRTSRHRSLHHPRKAFENRLPVSRRLTADRWAKPEEGAASGLS